MDLFENIESFNLDTLVEDSSKFVRSSNPRFRDETKEDYQQRLFDLTNEEIERRILISGKKRPDYSLHNLKFLEKCKK